MEKGVSGNTSAEKTAKAKAVGLKHRILSVLRREYAAAGAFIIYPTVANRYAEEVGNLNSESLDTLNCWKEKLKAKKANRPLDPPYDNGHSYDQMPSEVRLIFDALLDVTEALTKS